jgi:parvulin-like peptidyl-prolyl isomerase
LYQIHALPQAGRFFMEKTKMNIKRSFWTSCALSLVIFVLSGAVGAEEANVLVRKGESVITHEQFDARIQQIPERDRLQFVRNGAKVDRMLKNLILIRQISDAAKLENYDQDPDIALQMQLAADKRLADSWVEKNLADSPAADYEQMAEEYYLANSERFVTEASIDVSHILIKTVERSEASAREIAADLLSRLLADPEAFSSLVTEYSEDPSAADNDGHFEGVTRGMMVKAFEDAAFSMAEPGLLPELVQTPYGFHIIRLDAINPSRPRSFDEMKLQLVTQQKSTHENRIRLNFIESFSTQPLEIPEGAIETMLQRYFGENLEDAPDYSGVLRAEE